MESTRVDRWLWAVRLFRRRSSATDACRSGHVRVNGSRVKPSAPVQVGDRVQVRVGDRERIAEVVRVIDARVAAPIAAECLIDHSPPPPAPADVQAVPRRERGAGRPSKRERRQLDRLRKGQGRQG